VVTWGREIFLHLLRIETRSCSTCPVTTENYLSWWYKSLLTWTFELGGFPIVSTLSCVYKKRLDLQDTIFCGCVCVCVCVSMCQYVCLSRFSLFNAFVQNVIFLISKTFQIGPSANPAFYCVVSPNAPFAFIKFTRSALPFETSFILRKCHWKLPELGKSYFSTISR